MGVRLRLRRRREGRASATAEEDGGPVAFTTAELPRVARDCRKNSRTACQAENIRALYLR